MRWWRRGQTAEQKRVREGAVRAESNDEPQQALDRARAAKTSAAQHLATARGMSGELRRERVVNHLATDVYESMRRRR
jgi:hypothetical protein